MDLELTQKEADNITAGVPQGMVIEPIATVIPATLPNDGELSLEEATNIRAGMPQAMVEEQMRYMQGLGESSEEYNRGGRSR